MTKIDICDGKYTIVHEAGHDLHVLRHGAEWRDFAGDGFVLACALEIVALREHVAELEWRLEGLE